MMRRLTRLSKFRRAVVAAVMLGMIPLTLVSCYGAFPLTNSLYRANGNITNKWVRSIVLFLLGIFGVYGICILVDAIILNLVEFWSGTSVHISKAYDQPDGSTVALETSPDGKTLTMTITKEGKTISERRFVRGTDGHIAVQDAAGAPMGTVTPTADGGFAMENSETKEKAVMTSAQIQELKLAQGGL